MFNILKNKFQLLCSIIKYNNIEKSKYDNYLAIFILKLLLYIVVGNALFCESGKNFV